jgi:hypothetical protein
MATDQLQQIRVDVLNGDIIFDRKCHLAAKLFAHNLQKTPRKSEITVLEIMIKVSGWEDEQLKAN